mmetsp:Transcript_10927/g.35195  ORF Transcript_10927/g.35195 Transcript_10927/m.35195 type:complete len:213 (+) Transcript_10927:254-892(+)
MARSGAAILFAAPVEAPARAARATSVHAAGILGRPRRACSERPSELRRGAARAGRIPRPRRRHRRPRARGGLLSGADAARVARRRHLRSARRPVVGRRAAAASKGTDDEIGAQTRHLLRQLWHQHHHLLIPRPSGAMQCRLRAPAHRNGHPSGPRRPHWPWPCLACGWRQRFGQPGASSVVASPGRVGAPEADGRCGCALSGGRDASGPGDA